MLDNTSNKKYIVSTAMNPNEPTENTKTPIEAPQQPTVPTTQKKRGFPIKTFLLILVLALITAGLVTLALMPKKPAPEESVVVAKITPNPIQTTLTISSTPVPQATPSSYTTDVVINTGQNKVTAVQLELSFDPNVLTKVNIEPGSFFINPSVELKNIDTKNGRITFAISPGDKVGALGQGILAKISFTAPKNINPTKIDFLPKTKVSAEDTSESVLKSTIGAQFSLGTVPTLIVSPTATPSAQ
jgi:hypothetical protein